MTTRSEVPSPEKATSNTTVPHFERPLLDIVLVDEAEEGDVIEHDRGDGHDNSLGFHNGMVCLLEIKITYCHALTVEKFDIKMN